MTLCLPFDSHIYIIDSEMNINCSEVIPYSFEKCRAYPIIGRATNYFFLAKINK